MVLDKKNEMLKALQRQLKIKDNFVGKSSQKFSAQVSLKSSLITCALLDCNNNLYECRQHNK